MNIKIATSKEERNRVFQIRKSVFVEEQQVPLELELDEYEDDAIHFIGIQDDMPMAASRLRWSGEYGKLERICILKHLRGQSYGKQLIEAMEQTIQEHGYSKAILGAQTHAVSFYERLGYQVVSEEFIDAGIPHVIMSKALTS
ncbi:MAG TPA: GNAT family N-acetyltransferase [Virgibacillus sp.]|nr:GNAT family N-acetyltransferase [Virgibacillus sp.]